MSKREWLVLMATAQGYAPSEDDTDTDLVWVIRNYPQPNARGVGLGEAQIDEAPGADCGNDHTSPLH